jgi:hypothetical protein
MILQDYKEYKLEKKITILPRRGSETCEANLSHDLNFFQNKNDPQDNVCDAEQFTRRQMNRSKFAARPNESDSLFFRRG